MSNSTVSVSVPVIIATSTAFTFSSPTVPSSSPPPSPPSSTPPSPSPSESPDEPPSTPSDLPDTSVPPEPEPTTPTEIVVISSGGNGDQEPLTILITSTSQGPAVATNVAPQTLTSSRPSSSTSDAPALGTTSAASSTDSGGLTAGGKIAVAVVVPVAAVALLVLAALFLWRRRKQRKDAEELRRKEVEEYGFNPNNDPALPPMGVANSNEDPSDMREKDGAGYRGWGTTSTARKPSTTLSSGNGQIGVARSDSGSNPGGYHAGSPTAGTDVHSNDPLVGSPGHRPETGDSETIGALGGGPAAGSRTDRDIHRGPSNASSAYSAGHRSDISADGIPGGAPGQAYYNDGLYYDDAMPQHGPYGDSSFNTGQPVIRDVQARRNTRIENPSVFPQQGNAGISQNF